MNDFTLTDIIFYAISTIAICSAFGIGISLLLYHIFRQVKKGRKDGRRKHEEKYRF